MSAAPAMRAPCTVASPTPPSPWISTVAPASTCAVFSTAPTPVCTAQPITQATSSGTSGSTLIAPFAGVITYSASAPRPTPRSSVSPPRESPVLPSGNAIVAIPMPFTHRLCWPRWQK